MRILDWEKKTIRLMVKMYCRDIHQTRDLCEDCSHLLKYALERISFCPFGEDKPRCSGCEVHCYRPEMREKIRVVMKYSGPKMIYYRPIIALRYILSK